MFKQIVSDEEVESDSSSSESSNSSSSNSESSSDSSDDDDNETDAKKSATTLRSSKSSKVQLDARSKKRKSKSGKKSMKPTSKRPKTSGNEAGNRSNKYWSKDETEAMLNLYQKLKVSVIIDKTGFTADTIFSKVSEKLLQQGYTRKASQVKAKFGRLKTKYNNVKAETSNSGAGTESRTKLKFFKLLDQILSDRPVNTLKGSDSMDSNEERLAKKAKTRKDVGQNVIVGAFEDGRRQDEELMKRIQDEEKRQRDAEMSRMENMMGKQNDIIEEALTAVVQGMYMQIVLNNQFPPGNLPQMPSMPNNFGDIMSKWFKPPGDGPAGPSK